MTTRLASLLASAVWLAACSETINGKSIAEPEVARFHERLQARDFDGIFEAASDEFKTAAPRERVLALFEAIDRKLGPLQQTQQVNWNVNTHNLTTTVVLVYQSKYRDGSATETFTFLVDGASAELMGYNINSMDMLIN